MLRTDQLDFELQENLIATTPAEPRDAARMLVVSRTDPSVLEHRHVRDLPEYLRAGDLMVLNTTCVLPARFEGTRVGTGGKLPGLYLGRVGNTGGTPVPPDRRWLVLLKGGHLHPGVQVALGDGSVRIELVERSLEEPGSWAARVHGAAEQESDSAVLERVGMTPLPPYILQARKQRGIEVSDSVDRARYQTVFAAAGEAGAGHEGSVAAPTAGLHLTTGLLDQLARNGVKRAQVVLHVGTGTFKPVEAEYLEQHAMHEEWCSLPRRTLEAILATRSAAQGSARVLCVGTTTARALETYARLAALGEELPASVGTRLLIAPGHQWRWVDMMLTNFHLPRSTLLAMVASLFDAPAAPAPSSGEGRRMETPSGLAGGISRLMEIYRVAIGEGYRFFSYGDAMLVLP